MSLGAAAGRVVIKIGTSSLMSEGRPDPAKLDALADAVVQLRADGVQPVLIASGAIAAGDALLLTPVGGQPAHSRQLAAAVGQGVLFDACRQALAHRGLLAAQILLTPPDLTHPEHRDSARTVVEESLASGLVPVVNENDAVMVRNNDVLAALLAAALGAARLVLLTDVPGLFESDPRRDADARLIPEVLAMTPEVERLAGLAAQGLGTGGMPAKLCAAWIASMAGVPTVIAGADSPDVVVRAVVGKPVGTLVHPRTPDKEPDLGRLWRALGAPPAGRVVCRPEAVAAVRDGRPLTLGHSITVEGAFTAGSVVDVLVPGQGVIARGRASTACDTITGMRHPTGTTVIHHVDYISFLEA
ncbi:MULTISPECIES: glutamate 5-kinase [unclassified Streptomyces]|uniref:glutamate 5-kinase n=1 Tax=unclassified Streptomyces TaxID=2593676 RepID=UPI003639573C